tara:strand:- start:2054 stop:2668 length:615 start_codon:yes stop_codon:yes gene_type:complete
MNKNVLKFKYKGNRNYVHGTDIINETIKHLNYLGYFPDSFEISFKNQIRTDLEVCVFNIDDDIGENLMSEDVLAFATFRCAKKTYNVLYKKTEKEIEINYPFSEDKIIKQSILNQEKKSITYLSKNNYTIIELIVVMNKHLLTKLNPNESGKWYFGKLKLEKNILAEKFSEIQIILIKNIGVRYTQSLIKLDESNVGFIYFSMK